MNLEAHVQALREDLGRMAALGDESTARAAELLGLALDSAMMRRLQEALAEAALEVSAQLQGGHVDVRLAGGDPEFVYVGDAEPEEAPAESSDEAYAARITLRLPDSLKSRLEDTAATAGLSLNTWIVQALARALEQRPQRTSAVTVGRRLTGYGRN